MTNGPQVMWLPDGQRLHLHHGPIDMVLEIWGTGRTQAFEAAVARFDGLLQELVDELPFLQQAVDIDYAFRGPVAQKMQKAVAGYLPEFVTPMAAVAGSVADEIARVITGVPGVDKAYVNNGGDVALVLGRDMSLRMDVAEGLAQCLLAADMPVRGVATSGWRGRSLSFGIADAVTVLAGDAATADAAATMICNQVTLSKHPKIQRQRACDVREGSDLGGREVTVAVGTLGVTERRAALMAGRNFAEGLCHWNSVVGGVICLQGEVATFGQLPVLTKKD